MASKFKRVQTQFIAALGDPTASAGTDVESWGIWRVDPGPRGVRLHQFKALEAGGGVAPRGGWKFDPSDWWLEEHGLIMEKPDFPVPAGRYIVTGDREVTTVMTIDTSGGWALEAGTLHDVTHLPCRSARYTPAVDGASPANAKAADFPVKAGSDMPDVEGCTRQDYAVIFVIAIEEP